MRIFLSFLPLNIIPILAIYLYDRGVFGFLDRYTFALLVAALLLLTLSLEMIKSAMFAPKGSASWIDFFFSLLLLVGLLGYLIFIYVKVGDIPDKLYWLALEAQMLDVIVGFYIAITNARRDIGAESL